MTRFASLVRSIVPYGKLLATLVHIADSVNSDIYPLPYCYGLFFHEAIPKEQEYDGGTMSPRRVVGGETWKTEQ